MNRLAFYAFSSLFDQIEVNQWFSPKFSSIFICFSTSSMIVDELLRRSHPCSRTSEIVFLTADENEYISDSKQIYELSERFGNRTKVTEDVTGCWIRTHFSTKLFDGTIQSFPSEPCWISLKVKRVAPVEQTRDWLFDKQHTCRKEPCPSTEKISFTTAKCSISLILTIMELSSVRFPRA